MSESSAARTAAKLDQARRDIIIAAVVAAIGMIGAALFASTDVLWGVALGALISLINLAVLARIGAELVGSDQPRPTAALKAAAKVLALMAVVIFVLYTRPHLAFGLCLGLALPGVAGLVLALRPRRSKGSSGDA